MEKFKLLGLSIFLFIVFTGMNVVYASQGRWVSPKEYDLDGISTVKTSYAGGNGNSTQITVIVRTWNGGNVGTKTENVSMNKEIKLTAVGLPLSYREGVVEISSSAYHVPSFNG